ncbi:MAG: cell envelope integrity protein CreD [Dokdonella sp.]
MSVTTAFNSATFKVFAIGFLALLMLIPLAQVNDLVYERSQRADTATATIASRWGGEQILGGPVLVVPVRQRVLRGNKVEVIVVYETILPDRLMIGGPLLPELRRYGIYDTPVYTAKLQLEGAFIGADLLAIGCSDCEPLWELAELRLPVSDVRGIREVGDLWFGDKEYRFGPGSGGFAGIAAVSTALPMAAPSDGLTLPFSMEITLAGTRSLSLLPTARQTTANLSATWPDPGFDGAFLPVTRKVGEQGFSAEWKVLDFNRRIPQHWREGNDESLQLASSGFGVSLLQPAATYQQNTRAGKYGLLFIGLTFVAFFLFEVLRRWRVHPVQYLLVGFALCLFYVVLLALSEQIGFAIAYACAAAVVVAMVGGYAITITRSRRAGASLGAALAMVYGLLYALIVSEDYALLTGSIGLVVVLGVVMYLTRRIDWYNLQTAGIPANQ